MIGTAIRDTQVLITKDNFSWDWHLISAILQWPDDNIRKLDDQNVIRYYLKINSVESHFTIFRQSNKAGYEAHFMLLCCANAIKITRYRML